VWWFRLYTSSGSSPKLNVIRCSFAALRFCREKEVDCTVSKSGLKSDGSGTTYVIRCFMVVFDIEIDMGLS
jgi:hypothetical protein